RDKNAFFKPRADQENTYDETSFGPNGTSEVTPKATAATARMSNADLLEHGFTKEDIDVGKHLPEVGGGSQEADKEENTIWFSKAAKIAEEKLGGKGSGDQMLATLKNNGVKGDELEYTGLEDFLKGKDKVTKQEVLDYIDKNGIKLEETTKGEKDEVAEAKARKQWEDKKAQRD